MAQPNLQEPDEEALPIFKIERVQLQFSVSANFVAAQVANNVLILALSTGRLLRIDLDSPSDIDGLFVTSIPQIGLAEICSQTLIYHGRRPTWVLSVTCSSILLLRI